VKNQTTIKALKINDLSAFFFSLKYQKKRLLFKKNATKARPMVK